MALKRKRIAFITLQDPRSRVSWSGIYSFMGAALQKHCGDVDYLGPADPERAYGLMSRVILLFIGIIDRISRRLLRKTYNYKHSIIKSLALAKFFEARLSERDYDLIIAPSADDCVAFLNTEIPIISLNGATFASLYNYYPCFSHFVNTWEGHTIGRSVVQQSSALIFASEWAAKSALDIYHASSDKVFVIPWGANLDDIPSKETVLSKKKSNRCRLLFLGVNWERKGGALAFRTLLKLEEMGLAAELIVCGCAPPEEFKHERMTVIPFLDKSDDLQFEELKRFFLQADFLLVPTRAECFGIVFCEASAYGLPVISTQTGGTPGAVRNGENGYLLPLSATAEDYAKLIYEIYQDDQRYDALVKTSRRAYEERLNWDAFAIALSDVISRVSPSEADPVMPEVTMSRR
jgi:glycosyltransferase involved in cell wall biosynthesis